MDPSFATLRRGKSDQIFATNFARFVLKAQRSWHRFARPIDGCSHAIHIESEAVFGHADWQTKGVGIVVSQAARTVRLSDQELAVCEGVAQGLPNKQIAQALKIGQGTVSKYLQNVYNKAQVRNRASLVSWCYQNAVFRPKRR